MTTEEWDPLWSDVRQATMPAFEARLFRERAGLDPEDALKWWEQYILSGEAADAIAADWSLDDVVRAREASMSVREAIQFSGTTGLNPADVVLWWQAGVQADEVAEALASGWSLDEAVRRHPAVVQRIERQQAEGQEAEARRARAEAESRQLGEVLRAREEAERAQLQRRRSVVDGLDIHVDASGSAVRFWIAASDPTYWAVEIDKRERNELGERDSLQECLALVAERVSQIGGTIREVACKQVGPEELLAASDGIAHLCERQVALRLDRGNRRPPPGVRLAAVDEFDDIYDDDDEIWDDGRDWGDSHDRLASGGDLLMARRVSVDDTAFLMPALPEAWPGFVRHSDSVVSVGGLFLILGAAGEWWELVGRFDDPDDGIAAAEQVLGRRDVR